MIIIVCMLLLLGSFFMHIYYLFLYVKLRDNKYLKRFINTAVSNVVISGALIFIALYKPDTIRTINLKLLIWMISGLIMVIMLTLKISMFRRIYKRCQDPENYHFNFFGKKVLHTTVVKPVEIAIFFMSMPFFLFAGAYFIARLINLFLYKHLTIFF